MKGQAKAFLTRIDRTTLTGDVCRRLVTHLVRGDWTEGERIPSERELCEQFGVGRASLREALKALEIMGMLEVRIGDGTFVCNRSEFLSRPLLWAVVGSTQSDVHEVIEARRVLEKELAEFAAERATPEDLVEIGRYIDEMQASIGDLVPFLEADLNFHLAVARAARNKILLNAVQMMRNLMREWIGETLQIPGLYEVAIGQHRAILQAIAGKDRAEAGTAMDAHLTATGDVLLRLRQMKSKALEMSTAPR